MGKKVITFMLFSALFFLALAPFQASAEVRINEFEQNPPGSDAGNEWVELYSSEQLDLENWTLVNGDNGTFALNGTIDGFLVIAFPSLWLDNSDERVILADENNNIIDDTPLLSDSRNDNSAWNFCEEDWKFLNSSRGERNNCGGGSGGGGGGGNNSGGNNSGSGNNQSQKDGKKGRNETIRVRANVSAGTNEEGGGNPQLNILEKPSSLKFGQVAAVKASFLSDADYPSLLFFIYSEPKRVVRSFQGEQVTKSSRDTSSAVSARAYAGEEIEFSLPLKLADNCNKYYPEEEYTLSLAGFYLSDGEWKDFETLESFLLSLKFNDELCSSAQDAKEQEGQQVTGEAVQIFSGSKIIKSIGLWILIALTLGLLVVIWKRKLM